MTTRDMTQRAFDAALSKHGITPRGPLLAGYYNIGGGVQVYARNGGHARRAQLAYLLQAQVRHERNDRKRTANLNALLEAIGGRRDTDVSYSATPGGATIGKLVDIPVEHAAAVIQLLRELRA